MADTCVGISGKNTYGFYLFLIIILVFIAIILIGNDVSISKLKNDSQEKNKTWYKFLLLFNVIATIIVIVALIWASVIFYGLNTHPQIQQAKDLLNKEIPNQQLVPLGSAYDQSGNY